MPYLNPLQRIRNDMLLQAGDRRQLLQRATTSAHRRLDDLVARAGLLDSPAEPEGARVAAIAAAALA